CTALSQSLWAQETEEESWDIPRPSVGVTEQRGTFRIEVGPGATGRLLREEERDAETGLAVPPDYAPQPLPSTQDVAGLRASRAERLFERECGRGADVYTASGMKDEAWDEEALLCLTEFARVSSGLPSTLPLEDLASRFRTLVNAGCRDPLIYYGCGRTLSTLGREADAAEYFREAAKGFQQGAYGREWLFRAASRMAEWLEPRNRKESDAYRDMAMDALRAAYAGGGFTEADRWPIYEELNRAGKPFNKTTFYMALKDAPGVDPWLVNILGGEAQPRILPNFTKKGISISLADNTGTMPFEKSGSRARFFFEKAWEIDSGHPASAVGMIASTMSFMSVQQGTSRLWFDRAVAADLTCREAYDCFIKTLQLSVVTQGNPRYDFALECLNTERFDTEVPLYYAEILRYELSMMKNAEERLQFVRNKNVLKELRRLFEGCIAKTATDEEKARYQSLYAEHLWYCAEEEEARRLFEELGDKVLPEVYYRMGTLGITYDKVQTSAGEGSVYWCRKAAELGYLPAQLKLAEGYGGGIDVDFPKNPEEAAKWYTKAAEQGSVDAMYRLGRLYWTGQELPQDLPKAIGWFQQAAERNDIDAQRYLGQAYEYAIGVSQDGPEAVKWYERAVEQGDSWSMASLGELYRHGRGVPQDYAKAAEWYERGVANKDCRSMYLLGCLYHEGNGVPVDRERAILLWKRSAAGGYEMAQEALAGSGLLLPEEAIGQMDENALPQEGSSEHPREKVELF
ncbi:MAG: tetratricopeptide repeat protein, partial [Planctomycetota bacterium]